MPRFDPYSYQPRPFSYTPDPNDPEIGLRRRMLDRLYGEQRGNLTNEISRSGLIGSSAAFNLQRGLGTDRSRALEDVAADVYRQRRGEAFNLYSNLESQRFGLLGNDYLADQANRSRLLGGLGELAGLFGYDYLSRFFPPRG